MQRVGRLVVFAFLIFVGKAAVAQKAPYKYFRVGNSVDVTRATRPGTALVGGGKDLDEAFRWLCGRSGGGDFLIIRATGTDAYNPYVQQLCHENSVATLVIPSRPAAGDPFVAKTIREAEVIFISGGDQANYINFWRGTPVQSALNEAIRKGVPIGGTSAGLAVMGEFIYTAQNDLPDGPDLTSKAAMLNPFHHQVVIVHGFLDNPVLRSVITDSHFVTRDRMGRLLVFLARIRQSNPASGIKGIGIDEHTAVLLTPDGKGRVVGTSAAYFLRPTGGASALRPNTPLSISGISVQKVLGGGSFNLKSWSGDLKSRSGDSVRYSLSVVDGTVRSTQSGGGVY